MTPVRRRGRLIAIEGIDGSGKTTFARALARRLRRSGRSVAVRREPADRALGALAQRTSVTDPWTGGVYFTLDRLLARPALTRDLERNALVVSDRSFYSTLAYQGSALGPAGRRRMERLQRAATIAPDVVVFLELPPVSALRRLGTRAFGRGPLERRAVLERVARAYRRLARRGRWIVVDARRPTADLVLEVERRLAADLPRVRVRPGARARRRT